MRVQSLNGLDGGITRLRIKGGANPRTLYDLVNGYVAQDGSIHSRPGTEDEIVLPPGTIGLTSANGKLVVFSSAPVVAADSRVAVEILRHPNDPSLQLVEIHFAGPLLGDANGACLYVAAEFSNGDVFHYWQRRAKPWQPGTTYKEGDTVQPTVTTGFMYVARMIGGGGVKRWAANENRAIGDVVQPTVPNGYEYEVVEVSGDPTRSAATEPAWAASDGAETYEFSFGDGVQVDSGASSGSPQEPPPDTKDRYGIRIARGDLP